MNVPRLENGAAERVNGVAAGMATACTAVPPTVNGSPRGTGTASWAFASVSGLSKRATAVIIDQLSKV